MSVHEAIARVVTAARMEGYYSRSGKREVRDKWERRLAEDVAALLGDMTEREIEILELGPGDRVELLRRLKDGAR